MIERKIREKIQEKIENKLGEMIEHKIEETLQCLEGKIEEMLRDQIDGQKKKQLGETIAEILDEKIDCKMEEKEKQLEEQIEKKLEEKIVEQRNEWVTVRDKSTRHVQGRTQTLMPREEIPLSNRFSVLETIEEPETKKIRYMVIGDSRMRPLGKVFCGRGDRCVIRPGAKVADLAPIIQDELRVCAPEAIIVQVGVNDVGPRRSVQLVKDFQNLLQTLKEARKPVIITGILPRAGGSSEWCSRALAVNHSVSGLCASMGLMFVDMWDSFYGWNEYYLGDGLHLSDVGANVLGAAYVRALQEN